ncbi:LysR family transcriptional regulator [Selenomonas sp.]|uniref:LysR family transcriptional regulator n=1 Tax=Selenomonas sp. TaxID=2053611 RepID=UPI0025E536A5|nr:LysR family transcriptional regulator [Selenomonas sp.]MCI6285013.1 LysR family transcriptional regulator [Selenomonas sp.]
MDEWKLRTFFAALRLGSFSKAAVELHTTQSAVSQMIRRMEDELGCTLLTRTHAGVALTTAGQALLPSLLAAETALGNVASRAAAITRGQEIPLAIGAFASIANTLLPAALQAYQAEHPRARFHLFIGTDILPEWLLAGKVDVALGDASRLGTFAFEPVADDPYFAVVPRTSVAEDMTALTHEALAQLPLLMAPRNVLAEHLAALSQRQTIIDCDDDSSRWRPPASARRRCPRSALAACAHSRRASASCRSCQRRSACWASPCETMRQQTCGVSRKI